MAEWDGKMKNLLDAAPEDFVKWLYPGATFIKSENPNFATRSIRSDGLYWIEMEEKPALFHPEFQIEGLPEEMGRRVWEYNVEASIKYQAAVQSVVIYPKRYGRAPTSPYLVKLPNGKVIHEFHYDVIDLPRRESGELFEQARTQGLPGILPLVFLTEDGREMSVIKRVAAELREMSDEPKRSNLLGQAFGVAAQALDLDESMPLFSLLQEEFMFTRFLMDSPGIRYIRKLERQSMYEEMRQMMLQTLFNIIQASFPGLLELAERRADSFTSLEQIQVLSSSLLLMPSEQKARQLIMNVGKATPKKQPKRRIKPPHHHAQIPGRERS